MVPGNKHGYTESVTLGSGSWNSLRNNREKVTNYPTKPATEPIVSHYQVKGVVQHDLKKHIPT